MNRILDFINGELQMIADELRQELVDIQYDDMVLQRMMADPRFYGPDYGADDCNGDWAWD